MKISARMTIPRQIFILVLAMPTILTFKSMVSKQAAVAGEVVPVKQSVCPSRLAVATREYWLILCSGRVAAGAIAEKYLKQAHGIEIVAFVSSVGQIHLPSTVLAAASDANGNSDEMEDALSPEFRNLLATITREEVDKFATRCPHEETSERMIKVCSFKQFSEYTTLTLHPLDPQAHYPSQGRDGFHWGHRHLCGSQRPCRTRRAGV